MTENSNDTERAKGGDSLPNLVRPFEDWSDGRGEYFGLCMKNGKPYNPPEGDEKYTEWHIGYMGGGIWEIEYSRAPECQTVVFRGHLPTREAFRTIMVCVENGFDVANAKSRG